MNRDEFSELVRQEVLARCEIEGEEDFAENAFTSQVVELLAESGEIDDVELLHYKGHGSKINGYIINPESESIDLFVTHYTGQIPPATVDRATIEQNYRYLNNFTIKARNNLHEKLEESSLAFDAAFSIREAFKDLESISCIRLFLLTDGIVKVKQQDSLLENLLKDSIDLGQINISYEIWDIERLFRLYNSGHAREEINVDIIELSGRPLPCLAITDPGYRDYVSYLAFVPGSLLVGIYGKYGSRLLERNVRSFLQAKGAVNKGIRNTLKEEPDKFLAYNNGLTATASHVELSESSVGAVTIKRIHDLQIVNGGQTTASIFHAARKDGIDISSVLVQLKLNVVKSANELDGIVANISKYANSQNKVNIADFSANDPFHRKLEELSRTIWAPAVEGTLRQTRWFYERARGQYADERNRSGSRAKIREFELINPRSQMFTKTDVAKYEYTWMQNPAIVSKGAQKNFAAFTIEIAKRPNYQPDEQYFKWLVAKAILFKRAEKLVQAQQYGGYRANIVTYTLALIAHATQQRLDLEFIWKIQSTPESVDNLIITASQKVHRVLISPPGGRNITEWCKSPECWARVQTLECHIQPEIPLIERSKNSVRDHTQDVTVPGIEDEKKISEAAAIPASTWFELSAWAKDTNNLAAWQRSLAYSLGKLSSQGRRPSVKQSTQGMLALEAARKLGFRPTR